MNKAAVEHMTRYLACEWGPSRPASAPRVMRPSQCLYTAQCTTDIAALRARVLQVEHAMDVAIFGSGAHRGNSSDANISAGVFQRYTYLGGEGARDS